MCAFQMLQQRADTAQIGILPAWRLLFRVDFGANSVSMLLRAPFFRCCAYLIGHIAERHAVYRPSIVLSPKCAVVDCVTDCWKG